MGIIKNHDKKDLDHLAETFLAQHGKLDGRALMIDLVIQNYGYEIFSVQGLNEIAEAYVPIRGKRIWVDEDQYQSGSFRWRFTLAEELAHVLLHRPLFEGKPVEEVQRIQAELTDPEYLIVERNAKYLAGSLLMPRSDFEPRFQHFWKLQSHSTSNEFQILKYVIRQLSMDYYASCYAVAIRAVLLGLIDKEQRNDILEYFSS